MLPIIIINKVAKVFWGDIPQPGHPFSRQNLLHNLKKNHNCFIIFCLPAERMPFYSCMYNPTKYCLWFKYSKTLIQNLTYALQFLPWNQRSWARAFQKCKSGSRCTGSNVPCTERENYQWINININAYINIFTQLDMGSNSPKPKRWNWDNDCGSFSFNILL